MLIFDIRASATNGRGLGAPAEKDEKRRSPRTIWFELFVKHLSSVEKHLFECTLVYRSRDLFDRRRQSGYVKQCFQRFKSKVEACHFQLVQERHRSND
ncbi:hypothetical protein V6Z77_007855 [Aspergillus fumigatus]|jgi:hypothetical protein